VLGPKRLGRRSGWDFRLGVESPQQLRQLIGVPACEETRERSAEFSQRLDVGEDAPDARSAGLDPRDGHAFPAARHHQAVGGREPVRNVRAHAMEGDAAESMRALLEGRSERTITDQV